MNSRQQLKILSWTGALLLTGCLLLINFIASYIPIRFDTSEGKIYSISSGTKQVLNKIEDPLIIRVIFSSNLPPQFKLNEKYVRDLLLEYRRSSHGRIRVEYDDPGKSPKGRQAAIEAGVAPAQLDVVARDRREVKECFMGLSFLYGDKKDAIPLIRDTVGLEYEITQRIKKLVVPADLTVGLVSNGDALTPSSEAIKELQDVLAQLFSVRTLDLAQDMVPPDVKSLWLIGPEKELGSEVVGKLKDYVNTGGTLGLLLDRRSAKLDMFSTGELNTGLDGLLAEWGIEFKKGLISDPRADQIRVQSQQGMFTMVNIIEYPFFPLIVDLNRQHAATKDLDSVVLPFVAPLVVTKEVPGLKVIPLARTSEFSWLDAAPWSVNPLQRRNPPADALKGPFNVGLLIEGQFNSAVSNGHPGRVILFSSSRFIRNDYPPKQSNFNLLLNLIEWSAQDEALLSIRSKGAALRPIKNFSDGIRALIKYALILFLPLMSMLVGLFIWRRENIRRALLPLKYSDA